MTPLYPNVSCLDIAGLMRTDLTGCKVRLFKGDYMPTLATELADLTAIEADFGGYAAITVATLLPVYIDPAGGASFRIPTVQFDADGTAPDNIVYGFWVETGGMTPALRLVGRFDAPVPMGSVGDALPLDVVFNFGAGQA